MASASPEKKPRRRGPLAKLLFTFVTFLVVVIFIEGLFSGVHTVHTIFSKVKAPVAERQNSQYDEELGWTTIPSLNDPDGYGPGVAIRINAQGFRGDTAYDAKVPAGRTRIIATGDSFTFGHSVGNEQTWPHLLGKLDDKLEVVNVGLGGYGLDQMYLRQKRDSAKLERHFQIFAFIMEDFGRTQGSSFNGYGKPQLALKDGELTALNQPVPRRGYVRAWLNQNGRLLHESRTVSVASQIYGKIAGPPAPSDFVNDTQLEPVLKKMWEQMAADEKARGSRLILAFVPIERDHQPFAATDQWRAFVKKTADELGIPFFDLVEDFRKVPASEVPSHFVAPRGETIYHRGEKGNAWLAQAIHDRLKAMK